MLNRAAAQGNFQYHSRCSSIKLTHLSFADYLLIFIDGSIGSVQQVLIQASMGMVLGSLPFRYLGVPLNSMKLSLVSAEPLIHQIKTKFSSWSVKSLSFSGRLLLIKTVIAGINTFWCSAFLLPKACIARINSLWNKACMFRLVWMLFFGPESVWITWFKEVILKGSVHNYWTRTPKQAYSWLVNKLLKLKSVVFALIKLMLQNGETSRFWSDNCTPFGDLYTHLSGSNSRLGIPQKATFASLCPNGSWTLPPARTEAQIELYSYLAQPHPDVHWFAAVWISRAIP